MKQTVNELLLGKSELLSAIGSMWGKLRAFEIKNGENQEQRENLQLLESVYKKYATLCGVALIAQAEYEKAMGTVLLQTEIIADLKKQLDTERGINNL